MAAIKYKMNHTHTRLHHTTLRLKNVDLCWICVGSWKKLPRVTWPTTRWTGSILRDPLLSKSFKGSYDYITYKKCQIFAHSLMAKFKSGLHLSDQAKYSTYSL